MQQQEATILSAELSGFSQGDAFDTALTESLQPDGITSLMGEIHTLIVTTVRMHHGNLNRFTGDTFMLVFHSNKTSKLAALHAVDTAFEINEQLLSFINDKKLKQAFSLIIGIASGNILSTEIGTNESKQQTIMGEAVNHAMRICQFAGEGQTIVDGPSHELVKDHGVFQSLEPIPLKGGTETLAIFELIEKKRRKLDVSSMERKIVSEMVGRNRESEQLESLIKKLIGGKGSVVNIVGKAGIGKSRLIDELKVQPLMEKVLLLEGRALSTGQNLSFHPITNLIKSWAGITEDDIPSASSEKLFQGIKQNTPEQADEIYAFLATMMGLPLQGIFKERVQGIEGEALEKLILKNLRDLIISAAKDKPRIYLVEDMHWADSSSITMFESLYKLSRNHPVMFINVLRPGYKETGDYILKWLVDNLPGDNITINVSPLADGESGELINNLLKKVSLPEKVASTIIRKTEGNPFFIEEVIRSFLDEGIIEIKEKEFIVTDKINDVNIPETINDVILSRVDKLDEKTRELLNTASVMGRNFYYKVLEEATDTIEELDERLAYLTEVQLITETKKKEEIEYLFKHALAQQLTYDSIIQQSRKGLHLKIAASIEKVFAENINEFYGTLAYHYTKAENKEKTIQYLILAGDESLKSGASSEALNFYKEALELIPANRKNDKKDTEVRDLEIKVAFAYEAVGMNKEAVAYFEILFEKYFNFKFAKTEKGILFSGIMSMLFLLVVVNRPSLFFRKHIDDDFELAIRCLDQWGHALATLNPKQFVLKTASLEKKLSKYNIFECKKAVSIFADGTSLFMWTGLSYTTSQKILDLVKKAGIENDPNSFVEYRFLQKMQQYNTGKWETDKDYQNVFQTALQMGKFWPGTIYLTYSGLANIEKGDWLGYSKTHKDLDELANSFDNSHARAQNYRLQAYACHKFGKIDKLIEILDEGLDYVKTTGHSAMHHVLLCIKVQVFVKMAELNKAENVLSEIEHQVEKHNKIPIYYIQYLLAKVKLDFERIRMKSKKDKTFKSMIKVLNKTSDELISQSKKMIPNLTEAYLIKAKVFLFLNNNQKVLKYFGLTIATGEKFNARLELSRAYFETGKFLSDPKTKQKQLNGLSGKDYLEKAKVMFEEMDLQWDLGEYKKFVGTFTG